MPFFVRAERLEIAFGESPLHVERIMHLPSGRVVCDGGEQRLLLRLPKAPSDPIHLTEVEAAEREGEGLAFTVADASGRYRLRVRILPGEHGLRFDLKAEGPEPIWMVEWKLLGLD